MPPKTIQFLPYLKSFPFMNEASVLEVALKAHVPLGHSCGGMGTCTTCRVIVVQSREALPERTGPELDTAEMREFAPEERLACQLPPSDGLVLRLPFPVDDGGST